MGVGCATMDRSCVSCGTARLGVALLHAVPIGRTRVNGAWATTAASMMFVPPRSARRIGVSPGILRRVERLEELTKNSRLKAVQCMSRLLLVTICPLLSLLFQ